MRNAKQLTVLSSVMAIVGAGIAMPAAADDTPSAAQPRNPATVQELQEVVVIGTVPLPGLGLPREQVPGNVQTATARDLKRQQSLDITELLNDNFSGVNLSESQDNAFQADVNYHGYTASPLLGTPQGLSVYMDGVRVNEAFGDTVNWDLIPESAIGTITLLSGSAPAFGLNTLGGALAVQTKSGHDYPGTQLQAYGGSFGRHAVEAETGGSDGAFDYFLTGNYFNEDGWRDLSPSTVKQIFGKAGWQNEQTDIDLSYLWANTSLIGNGAVPQSMLDYRRQAIFTAPDFTGNNLNSINLTGTQFLNSNLLLSANAYYRHLRTRSNNGDLNDDNYQSDEYDGPDIDCDDDMDTLAAFAYCSNGINRASILTQRTAGTGVQLTESHELFGRQNQAIMGLSFSHGTVDYDQNFQYGTLTPDRSVISTIDPVNPAETINAVGGTSKILGAYLTDTFSPSDLWHITAAVRFNRIQETLHGYSVNTDVGDVPGDDDDDDDDDDDGGSVFDAQLPLFGDHTYTRVNPSIGATFTPSKALTLYANYNEGNRAPTIIELGCSDPDQPCGLPNNFASDPDLAQVVSRTEEIGARGSLGDGRFDWSANLFHARNTNDIQYVATTSSEGYFANVGDTRRQGVDLTLGGKWDRLSWHLTYSFVDATYQSDFEVNAESNSTADDDDNIQVQPGNRIPLIARNTGRLRLDYAVTDRWNIGGSFIASSGIYLHGNENNANEPDGDDVIGTGRAGSYSLVNLQSTFHVTRFADIFVKAVNVFAQHYATAGFLTSNGFDADGTFRTDPDDWTNENSVSPGQPRGLWAGVRLRLE